MTVHKSFQVEIYVPARNLYTLGEGQQPVYHSNLPPFAKVLEAAIVEAGKQECLNISVHRSTTIGATKMVQHAVTIYVAASPFEW